MNKRISILAILVVMVMYISSCYKNKEDIQSLPRISFRTEVVPILTSGPCGCHNNGSTRAVQFSHMDTVFYDAILARRGVLESWVNGGTHPGGGEIDFAPAEKLTVKRWIDQGDPYDDGSGCTVNANVTYTSDIKTIYTTSCKGSTCHAGIAVGLDYAKLVAEKDVLTAIMSSGGATGHPGGPISLSTCTINTFKAWIQAGQPQ